MEKFVPVMINGRREDGKAAAKKYDIQRYPTVVFTDRDGNEEDRFVGCRYPLWFIKKIEAILRKLETREGQAVESEKSIGKE